ncbi:MAG: hypothetical protein NT105_03460 [Verrucomicrobia bacterium]|nr:hypothetical protein [Verrucomicrobiota bacterium]
MKTISLTILLLMGTVVVALGADTPATPALKKNKVTFEYSYPPPLTARPPRGAEAAPLPRVGSKEWLRRVDPLDRKQLSPWEVRRLNAWHAAYSFVEPPPSVNGFTSTWR